MTKEHQFVCDGCKRARPLSSASWVLRAMLDSRRCPFPKGLSNASGPWKKCKSCLRSENALTLKQAIESIRYDNRRRKVIGLLTHGTNLGAKDIPRSLIELKYAQLKLKKLCQRHET